MILPVVIADSSLKPTFIICSFTHVKDMIFPRMALVQESCDLMVKLDEIYCSTYINPIIAIESFLPRSRVAHNDDSILANVGQIDIVIIINVSDSGATHGSLEDRHCKKRL